MPMLEELGAHFIPCDYSGAQMLVFRCPKCRQRPITVNIWNAKATELQYAPGKTIRLHQATQGPGKSWSTLSITPSIDDHHGKPSDSGCTGWHGFVTNGVAE